jgi:hypothetical protein
MFRICLQDSNLCYVSIEVVNCPSQTDFLLVTVTSFPSQEFHIYLEGNVKGSHNWFPNYQAKIS